MNTKPEYFFQEQLKGEDPPAFATMRALYDLSGEIFARQPWSVLADEDLVLVEGASPGETCYCSVMGALGEVLSLHVYLGSHGYRLFSDIRSGDAFTVGEFFARARCLFVEFVKLGELTAPDQALLKSMGHTRRRGGRAPMFRSVRPGFYPWYVTESEARVLMECERATLAFWDIFVQNPEQDFWEKEDVYPLLVPLGQKGKERGYQIRSAQAPLPPRVTPGPPVLDAARVKQVRDSGFPSQGIWEVDQFYGAGMIGTENERKACFRIAIAINVETGFAYPPVVVSPNCSDGEALTQAVFHAIDGAHGLPVEVHVRSRESKLLLEPLARALGFPIKIKKSLPALDFAKSELLKMMGDPGPFTAFGPETGG